MGEQRHATLFVQELPWRPPEEYFAWLHGEPYLVFLDSAAAGDARSEASYLCLDPIRTLRFQHGKVTIGDASLAGDPLEILRRELATVTVNRVRRRCLSVAALSGFLAMGWGVGWNMSPPGMAIRWICRIWWSGFMIRLSGSTTVPDGAG